MRHNTDATIEHVQLNVNTQESAIGSKRRRSLGEPHRGITPPLKDSPGKLERSAIQVQKIYNVTQMKPESRSTREEISKNSRPKSAYRKKVEEALAHSGS